MISPETRAQIRRYFYAEHWNLSYAHNRCPEHRLTRLMSLVVE